ncbi:aldo/keto reductase [Spirosoma endophyticum]|uniref:Predicted oxidoreductase n=1 Tax=Spirosoma endophyticum TaxID=662367 RepID=A0A1I1LU72_9BACT|nr:aldo/keto reductase [Spirosoma endophyticum]SFC76817.1 Predicted oxidoreductase [Spirosoma endophyticum]
MKLTDYRTLGRSGLVVSPLSLGTMTFGNTAWGSPDDTSQLIFNQYVDAGGNFIDTADVYSGGRSEELVGQYIADRGLRDQVVLATKFGFNTQPGNPHAGGNGRKHIHQALESSLRRLKTDYVDLYWLHVWDMVTPVEEVLQTLGALVQAGKIRYVGFSDMPAWYTAKAATLAAVHQVPGPIAMQMEYSLVERMVEQEHIPAGRECGLSLSPWSPLAAGFLAGKYQRTNAGASGQGRLSGSNPFGNSKFTDRNWQILDVLRTVAGQLDAPLASVALAWLLAQPGVTAPVMGARQIQQLRDNLSALTIQFTADQLAALKDISRPTLFFTSGLKKMIFGGETVQAGQ